MAIRNKSRQSLVIGIVSLFFLFAIFPINIRAAEAGSVNPTGSVASKALLFLGNQDIPPVIFLQDNAPVGIAVDITIALAPYMKAPIEIRAINWTTAQTLFNEGKADALIQINQINEQKGIYDFSDALLDSQFSIFSRTERIDVVGLSSLHGLKVGVEKNSLPEQLLAVHPEIRLQIISNYSEGFRQISDGSIDAIVADYRIGSYLLAKNNIRGIRATGEPVALSYSTIAVKKGNTELLNEINTGLKTIKANGIYKAILTKWQPTIAIFQTQSQITREIYVAIIVILLIIFVVVIAWSITINKELKLRRRAEKYSEKLISSANAMVVCLDVDGRVILFNEAAEKISGYSRNEVLGRNWFELVVPRSRFPEAWKIFERFQKHGKSIVGDFQNPILTKNGVELMIDWRNSDLRDNGNVVGTISYGIDITERIKAENELSHLNRALRMVSDINQELIHIKGEKSFLEKACRIAVNIGGYRLAWIGYVEHDAEKSIRQIAQSGFNEGYVEHLGITWADTERGRGPAGVAVRTGDVSIVRDIATDPSMVPWRDDALKNGYRAVIALPLMSDAGTFGVFCIYSIEPEVFSDEEMKILREVSNDIAFGITAQRIQVKQKDAEEKFAAAFNASPNLISITRFSDGVIIEVNNGYSRMLGYSRGESIGKTTTELSIWENLDDRKKFISKLSEKGEVNNFETTLRRKDGTIINVIDAARTLELNGEKYVLSVVYDISDRKRAEEAVHKSETELKEAQRIGRLGSWSWDMKTDTIKWSDEYYNLIGFDPTQPPPNYENHLKAYTPESAALLDAAVKRNIQTGEPYELDLEIANPKTSTRWITARSETLRDADGKIVGLRGTAQDVTQLKEVEKLRLDFLMLASHQLRTPLSGTKWLVETLRAHILGPLSAAQEKYVDYLYRINERMVRLVSDMLLALRLESGEAAQLGTQISMAKLSADLILTTGAAAASRNIKIVNKTKEHVVDDIVSNQNYLNIILGSFLSNAINYSSPKQEIIFDATEDRDGITFTVQDFGIGIAQEEQAHIFERFYRATNAKKIKPEGTGLGLYIAKMLAQKLEGTVGFTSVEGSGSTFSLRIPRRVV